VVGVIDESAFTKKGAHSAGVARQHNGRLGKEDNCVRQESLGRGKAM
jgi:SRSO17 transposase